MSPDIIYFDQNLVHGKIENFGTGEMDEKQQGRREFVPGSSLPIVCQLTQYGYYSQEYSTEFQLQLSYTSRVDYAYNQKIKGHLYL